MLREDGDLAGDRGWIALAVPDIGIAGDDRQRQLFAAPADEKRHAPAAVRGGIVAGAVDAEVRPLHRDRSASEETARDLGRLREPCDARARLEQLVAERSMLAFVPARAEPEGEAAVARAIDRGRHLHEERRVPVRGATDHAAEGDPFRQDGPAGERDPALEHGAVLRPEGRIEMVVAPEAAEAQALDTLSRLHQLVPFDELTPHLQADVHGPGRYRDAGPVAAPIVARRRAASGRP